MGKEAIAPLLLLRAACVIVVVTIALAAFVAPRQALAYYNDVADSFPAAQELGSYGSPITGSQLPDGAYKVGARTTSRMCIMYTNPDDAEARDSKEQAIVTVSGGTITAVFYISKAYTHLYLGTQEQAVAATNAEGTDATFYIAGDPDEGYVPHMFMLPISALNSPVTVSTFSGGDRGVSAGRWYTRQFVFTMTDAEYRAALADAGSSDARQESGSQSSQDSQNAEGSENPDSSDEQADDQEDDESTEAPVLSKDNVESGDSSRDGRSGGSGGSGSSANGSGDDAASGAGSETISGSGSGVRRGVRLDIAGLGSKVIVNADASEEQVEVASPLATQQLVLVFALAALLVAGALYRAIQFSRSFGG